MFASTSIFLVVLGACYVDDMLKLIAEHEALDNVGIFLIMALASTDEEAPGGKPQVWMLFDQSYRVMLNFLLHKQYFQNLILDSIDWAFEWEWNIGVHLLLLA